MKLPLALLTAALLVTACTPSMPASPTADGPDVNLGTALTGGGTQVSGVSWRVDTGSLPAWLKVTPTSGTGPITLTFTADRAQGTPTTADQAKLSAAVRVNWTQGGASGTSTWNVTADQYVLRGRVVDAATVQGSDVGKGTGVNARAPQDARGVIVKYRSAAAQATALGRLGVSSAGDAALSSTRSALARLGLTTNAGEDLGGRRVALDVTDVEAALEVLRGDPNVEYAVPNAVLGAQELGSQALAAPVVPPDQYAGLQWGFKLLGYGAVWRDMASGAYNKPVTVAVIDTGVRFDHPDLQGQLYGPGEGALDVLTNTANGDDDGADTDPTDPSTPNRTTGGSHGTHVAGIIAARWGTNAAFPGCDACSKSGVVGASYRAPVKVLPVRVIDASGNAEVADVVNALRYASGISVTLEGKTFTNPHPAQVINLSLGGAISVAEARPMCEAVAEVSARDTLVVVAAGNGYSSEPYYPAACEGAVAVGAVTLSGASAPEHARYSNSYPQVMLSAPGGSDAGTTYNGGTLNDKPYPDQIFSTEWDYTKNQPIYDSHVGTSQAAPQVSALAALLLSKGVTQGRGDTLARMTATATDLGARGRDEDFGFGMIDPAAALGAPAVSDTLGLRLQSDRGDAFQPALDNLGRFSAYLPDATFTVTAGRDRNANGIYGEAGEAGAERQATLGPAQPQVELGDLTPAP
ncbi:S8 family serine peptidase [Deinococcus hopiensis]|uniref:Serine protease, subtilisin family n=1 Tax=Deinococcus hopiensis KR-140 TaxID=695939 RepID=A0A1W1VDW5_9DEIO|nr:S8 family serine peptidase [Deinococcus hopiensis]SMB91390.1 Serine protease, subtilisin family [Deinococcus hopiensis KR-140]